MVYYDIVMHSLIYYNTNMSQYIFRQMRKLRLRVSLVAFPQSLSRFVMLNHSDSKAHALG